MTAFLSAHVWLVMAVAFLAGVGVGGLTTLWLVGVPEDPTEDQRPHWMGHW